MPEDKKLFHVVFTFDNTRGVLSSNSEKWLRNHMVLMVDTFGKRIQNITFKERS